MNSGSNNHSTGDDGTPVALVHAEIGADSWRSALLAQRSAPPDHADFYSLAGYLCDTLAAIQSVAGVLRQQVDGYADGLDVGRRVYDDTRSTDPHERLTAATVELNAVVRSLGPVVWSANRFWSAIGHVGVEDVTS